MDTNPSFRTDPTLDSNEQYLSPREVAREVAYRLTAKAFKTYEPGEKFRLLEEARAWFELSGKLEGK